MLFEEGVEMAPETGNLGEHLFTLCRCIFNVVEMGDSGFGGLDDR